MNIPELESLGSVRRLEAFVARLYVDSAARSEFLNDRARAAAAAGLTQAERAAVVSLDAGSLELAARAFSHKQSAAQRRPVDNARRGWSRWFVRAWSWLRAV